MYEKRVLDKHSLFDLLAGLTASASPLSTIYAEASTFPLGLKKLMAEGHLLPYTDEIMEMADTDAVIREAEKRQTGAAIFWSGEEGKHVVLPPLPVRGNRIIIGEEGTLPLKETLERRYKIGVILMAWGSYGIGVFDGDCLVASKVGTGHIHKEHKKGGSSQKRFARRTEEQRREFLRRVSNRVEEILGKYALDYIFFGGNRLIRKPLWEGCRILEAYNIPGRVLETRYADRGALNGSLSEIMKSVVFSF